MEAVSKTVSFFVLLEKGYIILAFKGLNFYICNKKLC